MPRLILDFDPSLGGEHSRELASPDLAYFLSWAFSTRYGANHEMSLASLVLRGEFGVDLSPLLRFADREVDEPADQEELDRAWQDSEPLAETCSQILAAMASGVQRLRSLQENYPRLAEGLEDLHRHAREAAVAGSRLRLTFTLQD